MFDEAAGKAARCFAAAGRGGSEAVAHVGDVFVGLAEAGLLFSASSAEKELRAALKKSNCRTKTKCFRVCFKWYEVGV